MDRLEKLGGILSEQERITGELKSELEALKRDDLLAQNDNLRKRVDELEAQRIRLSKESESVNAENRRLKNELYQQLFNEKTRLAELSNQRLNAYFASEINGGQNRLSQFEHTLAMQIGHVAKELEQNRVGLECSSYTKLRELQTQANTDILAARQRAMAAHQELMAEKDAGVERLKNEPLTDADIARRGRQNNVEALLGLKLFNKLGIVFIVIGVIAAARFTYAYIPDALKAALIYMFGLTMLAFGEPLSRKRANIFSIGLTSGGVAVLYAATALSFFLLEIISMYPALILCVLITAVSFALSRRYNAQTIAAFALIGGYLPLSSIAGNAALIYSAIAYFILLNVFALSIASIKKWHATQFIGFALNTAATLYVTAQLHSLPHRAASPVAALYVFFSFVVYTAIPAASSYRTKLAMNIKDTVLLSLNTIFGSTAMFLVFFIFGLWGGAGALSAGLAVFYILSAILLRLKMPDEKSCRVLFYITGLTFAVLAVPIQFDVAYLSLGWLIEGVLLLSYGIYRERRLFKLAGWVICGLCLLVFLAFDIAWGGSLFFYKYMFITAGSLLITAALTLKGQTLKTGGTIFKSLTAVNLWFFLIYAVYEKLAPLITNISGQYLNFLVTDSLAIIVSLLYAYFIARIKPVTDRAVRGVSLGIYAVTIVWLIFSNTGGSHLSNAASLPNAVVGTVMLIAVNLLALFAVRDLLQRVVLGRRLGVEWYPVALSSFLVFLLAQNLIVTLGLSLNSVSLTVIFALTAFCWILYGFLRRYQYIRLFGLGLSFVTVIKLFLIDLSFLTEGMRIVSYFAMGVVLLAISFVYQYFSKRLEKKE